MLILRNRGSVRTCLLSLVLAAPGLYALQTPVGQTSPVQTVTVKIVNAGTTSATLHQAGTVLTKGSTGYDFAYAPGGSCALATAYQVGDTCTVNYTFTPRAPGVRLGAVQLFDTSGTFILGTALITAVGTGPVAVFPGNTATVPLGSGFSEPRGVALDPANNVFVADYANSQVKEILAVDGNPSATSPVITLGSGFDYPSGLALDGAGNVYVADTDNSAVKEILAFGGTLSSTSPVITIGSGFKSPTGVAVDGRGDVFVADAGNGAVKEILAVDGATSSTSTVIPLGQGFTYPSGVAVDHHGNVFVADYLGAAVKEILASNGNVSSTSPVQTVGSGFSQPFSVTLDAAGNVIVGDVGLNAVKLIIASDGVLSPASTVATVVSGYAGPYGVATDNKGDIAFSAAYDGNAVNALPLSTPPNLTFDSVTINEESPDSPQIIQLVNLGNAPLGLTTLSASNNFAVDHASTTCSTSTPLNPNESCVIGVDFIPFAVGPIQGALSLGNQQGSGMDSLYGVSLGIPPADPVLSAASGTYTLPLKVQISEATPGAQLYYVIDAGQPQLYSKPITISSTATLRAYAIFNGVESNVVVAGYDTVQPSPAAPVIMPNGGTFSTPQLVHISSSTPNTRIYYLLGDSNTPILYTHPFTVSSSTTIISAAISGTNSAWSESPITVVTFNIP